MFTKPVLVTASPYYNNEAEAIIIRPDSIVSFGIDSHNNMFVTSADGTRFYVVDSSEQTAVEICTYLYRDSASFKDSAVTEIFKDRLSVKE